VRLSPDAAVPDWVTKGDFTSITRARPKNSPSSAPPPTFPQTEVRSPLRWICLKLEGPFPFSQTGVLLSFIEPLSTNDIPIFAVSTFETDYVLIPEESRESP
jgi:uncharacterized protein